MDALKNEGIEEIIRKILEKQTLVVKREDNIKFADLVYDNNPLHRDVEYAKQKGLKDTPVLGTFLAASAEQYVLDQLKKINKLEELGGKVFYDYKYKINFKNFIFPDNEISWQVNKVRLMEKKNKEDKGDVMLSINCPKDAIQDYVSCRVTLFTKKPAFAYEAENNKKHFLREFENTKITEESLRKFCEILGKEPRSGAPKMYAAAFIPAALLEIASSNTGPEGVFLSEEIEFYENPEIGDFKTIITLAEEPRKIGEGYIYDFKGLVYQKTGKKEKQEEKIILRGMTRVFSGTKFKL